MYRNWFHFLSILACVTTAPPPPQRKALIHSDWSDGHKLGGVCRGGVADLRETTAEAVRPTDDPHARGGSWLLAAEVADSVCASVLLVARVGERTALFTAVVKTGPGRGEAVSSFGAAGTSHVCL